MRLGEAVIFLCIASGLHAAIWTFSPLSSGTTAAPGSGQHDMSIVAASASQQAMVAAWQRPPEAAHRTPDPAPLPLQAPRFASPRIAALAAPELPPSVSRLSSPQNPEPASTVDTTPAGPPPVKVQPVTRPKPRPDTLTEAAQESAAAQNQPARQARGTAGQTSSQSREADETNILRAAWGSQIHAKVERNLRHPSGTADTGTAKLALTVAHSGKLEGLRLVRSSGNRKLDDAAISAVKRSGRFSQAPQGLDEASYAFSLSLTFQR